LRGLTVARVFLSYDHEDSRKADAIVAALERHGHSVWVDREIAGGIQFGAEIESALERCDAVVVLWSERSVQSAWVRDEAAVGRDRGKLVPVTLDKVQPPIGFRQFQTIGIADWRSVSRARKLQELLSAVERLSTDHSVAAPEPTKRTKQSSTPIKISGAVAALLLIAGATLLWRGRAYSEAPVFTVAPADASAKSQGLAKDLLVKLGGLQSANADAPEIVDSGAADKASFILQVSNGAQGAQVQASAALLTRDHALLWSQEFERPSVEEGDLRQQLALTAARVLVCAKKGVMAPDRLDQETLKLYLRGCAQTDFAPTDYRRLVPILREISRRAPRFAGAWALLVGSEASMMGYEEIPADSPEGRTLRNDIIEARKTNAHMPEAYLAEAALLHGDNVFDQMNQLVARANKGAPNQPLIFALNARLDGATGRMNEAASYRKQAADADPLDPGAVGEYINALSWAGQLDAAVQELRRAERLWPGTQAMLEARMRYDLRYGDPNEGLRIIRSGAEPSFLGFESYLKARADPSKENVDRAIADARAQVGRNANAIGSLIQVLAEFSHQDEIYPLIEQQGRDATGESDLLFRPAFHRFRQSPRFMMIAKQIGLLKYWIRTDRWPDFCFESDLPYDCKKVAAAINS
jgi:tetratricopeptide (TPR) repeat protein